MGQYRRIPPSCSSRLYGLDPVAVWYIATVELPLLRAQARAIIAEEFPEDAEGPQH